VLRSDGRRRYKSQGKLQIVRNRLSLDVRASKQWILHGIGKIQSLLMPLESLLESLRNQDRVGQMYIRQSKKLGKRATNCIRSKIVGVSEYPFGFQNNGIRYADIVALKQCERFLELLLVIARKEAH